MGGLPRDGFAIARNDGAGQFQNAEPKCQSAQRAKDKQASETSARLTEWAEFARNLVGGRVGDLGGRWSEPVPNFAQKSFGMSRLKKPTP